MEQGENFTRLDVIGGSNGKATVETIVHVPLTPTHANIPPGEVVGHTVFIKAEDMPLPLPIFDQPKKAKKFKVLTKYGRITIEDPALSRLQNNTLILQVTDGQCCVRPSPEELAYVKKIAAILREHLTE